VDRPSALDLAFLDLETPQAPLHVGWTMRFAGTAPSPAALRRHLDARLDAVPRFRRRLVRPALGAPYWVDDPGFAIARHVFAITLPAPGGAAQLRETAGALLSRPLPPDQPLWRLYLVGGREGFALVGQAHHVLVDGIAALDVARLLFGPATPRAPGNGWAPCAGPSPAAAARQTLALRARAATAAARDAAGCALRPGAGATLRATARTLQSVARPAPATALDRSATRERVVGFGQVDLPAARDAGRRHGATVNDVLLTASALALRSVLGGRSDRPAALRALIPVSVRAGGDPALGNRITFLPVELPCDEPDVVRTLERVAANTRAAKAGGDAATLQALARVADALPGPGRRAVTRAAARAVGFNLVISNVPGPPVALELLGRPLTAIHPMVPLLHGHALTIGAVSYAGRLHLGLAADAAVLPEVADVARGLERAFDALRLVGPVAPAPRQRAANR